MKQSVIISFKWIILLVLLIVPIVANAKDITLYFTISPGLTITPFAKNRFEVSYIPNRPGAYESSKLDWKANKRAKFLYAHVKGILSLEIKDFGIRSLIYTCSNYDFYGERRDIAIEGSRLNFEKRRFTHAVAMGVGYRF